MSQKWVSHSRIECDTPPGVGVGHIVRATVDVRTSENDEYMVDYLAPVIASMAPDHGPTTGGYAILISGTDFGTGAYEPSLTFVAADWQLAVMREGAPATRRENRKNGLTSDGSPATPTLNINGANGTNGTRIAMLNFTEGHDGGNGTLPSTKDLATAMPAALADDVELKNMIESAAVEAASGDGKDASSAIANATMQAVAKLQDTSGAAQTVAAVTAAAVETIAGIEQASKSGEDKTEAAEKVLNSLMKKTKTSNNVNNVVVQRRFLEIDEAPVEVEAEAEAAEDATGGEATGGATGAEYGATGAGEERAEAVEAEAEANALKNPCKPFEAVDYTPRGAMCLRVLVDGRSCLEVTMVSDALLRCIVPEGIGKNLSIAAVTGNQTSMQTVGEDRLKRLAVLPPSVPIADKDQWRYDPPVVTFMYPDVGPTSGGFVLTLKGRNFGTRDWGNGTVQVSIGAQPCITTTWLSDNVVECIVPRGVGSRHPVEIVVGGQPYPPKNSDDALLFSYNPPIILDVSPTNGPTRGGYDLVITGRNFGRMKHNPQAFIGGVPCTAMTWISDTVIKCRVPEGHGRDKTVVVWVGEQHSDLENRMFKYDRPIVTSIEPSECRTIGDCLVRVKGDNFGHEQGAHIRVTIDGVICANVGRNDQPQWMGHDEMECVVGEGIGKDLDVHVEIADQHSDPNKLFKYESADVFAMRPNHGGVKGGDTIRVLGQNFGTPSSMGGGGNPNSLRFKERPFVGMSIGGNECAEVAWISDTEISCVTSKGSGGDLMPSITIGNQVSNDTEVLDESRIESLRHEAFEARAESTLRREQGDEEMANVYTAKASARQEAIDGLMRRAKGIMYLFDPPEIHSVSLNHGPAMGGTAITLTGVNFAKDSRVVFSTMDATTREPDAYSKTLGKVSPCKRTIVKSPQKIVCITPAGVGPGHQIHIESGGRRFLQANTTAITGVKKCPPPPDAPENGVRVGDHEYVGSMVRSRARKITP
jgi:hypothetical protein